VIKPILGKPLLALHLERVQRAQNIDRLIVVTSTDPSDDALVEICKTIGVECFRGSLEDVLDRFYQAALPYEPDHVVRLTGDCPLADPAIIDEVITFHLEGNYDYTCNFVPPMFPDGLDVEIVRFSALGECWHETELPSDREHVTEFVLRQPERYRQGHFKGQTDLSHFRWTVDHPEDFELIRTIYEALYPRNPAFTTQDVLDLIAGRPELATLNTGHIRNEGMIKSLRDDEKFRRRQGLAKSMALQDRAKKRIPGLSQLLSKRPDMFSYGVWPGYFSRAKGVEVWDLDGNRYVDMSIGGVGANILGYADAEVDARVTSVIRDGTSSTLNGPEEVELADLLCELHPWAEKVRFARTGGEIMAVAVRIARAFTGRDAVAFSGYHGWHDWYLAANLGTENALGEHLIGGLKPTGVPRALAGTAFPFRFNQLDELEAIARKVGDNLGAIVLEPIRNFPPTPEFVQGVRAIADRTGAVLIIDEISAGFRLNTGGAHLQFGFAPDLAVFSKALGNGYPIAAVIGRGDVMEAAQSTFISSTYWTERIGPTAALAMIEKHRRENVAAHLRVIGEAIHAGWNKAAEATGLAIHTYGLPQIGGFGFDVEQGAATRAYFTQLMIDEGFLATTAFYAMYAHREEHVTTYLAAVERAFARIVEAHRQGNLEQMLDGAPASEGFRRLN
jgi:glutamate-1-semialdehyde 2,1-aminomutase